MSKANPHQRNIFRLAIQKRAPCVIPMKTGTRVPTDDRRLNVQRSLKDRKVFENSYHLNIWRERK